MNLLQGGGQYEDLVLTTPGLISHWCMNETGGLARDRKFTNHGTQVGTVARAKEPPFPGAASIQPNAAAGSYINIPDDNSLDYADGPVTLEAWYRFTSDAGTFTTLFYKGATGAIHFTWNGTSTTDRWEGWIGTNFIVALTTPALSGWHLVHMQKNGSTRRVFLDGVDISSTLTAATGVSNATAMTIGGGAFGFPGYISEASIYNVILSPAQIMERRNLALGR